MSLYQLPNELIAHIGTFLIYEDNLQFGLSQKRIHAVLKRDGLDKPECKRLVFDNSSWTCRLYVNSISAVRYEPKKDDKYFSIQGEIMHKFRNIDMIIFHNTTIGDDIFKDLLRSRMQMGQLPLIYCAVSLEDPNLFVAVCKHFQHLSLVRPEMPEKFYCDEIFVELIPFTTFDIFSSAVANGYSLTDRTLEALADRKEYYDFEIRGVLVSFTVTGVKKLAEKLFHCKAFNKNYELGILKFEEQRNVLLWIEEATADHNCLYTVCRFPAFAGNELINYAIGLKEDNRLDPASIRFAVNLVQV